MVRSLEKWSFALSALLAVLLSSALPPAAGAADGRLEINQACVATGCFPGDTAGFPVETQAGRSYVLTSSLAVADANTRAVTLADHAVLDLNGFEIAGPTTCTGAPVTCSAAGTGDGIYAQDHTTIRNGTIRGMGRYGVAGQVGTSVEAVVVQGNASTGIYLNYGSDGPEMHLVRNTRVVGNGGLGILNYGGFGGIGTLITDCLIGDNSGAGLGVSESQITNSTILRNGSFGLQGSNNAVGLNTFRLNNGGNAQPQTSGSLFLIGTNVCGVDTTCP